MSLEFVMRISIPVLYALTAALWLLLAAKVPQLLPQFPVQPARLRRITILATMVALFLGLDACYWFVANLYRYEFLKGNVEVFYAPWKVLVVKFPFLISVVAFYLVLKFSGPVLANDTEQAYFSRFVDDTWDAVCITDASGRVEQWNKGATRLFGFSRAETMGRNLKAFLIPPKLHEETDRLWGEIRANRKPRSDYHALRKHANGTLVPIEISLSPIEDESEFKGFFGLMRAATTTAQSRYFRSPHEIRHSDPYGFVIMPFAEDTVGGDVWRLAIVDALKAVGLRPLRADTETLSVQIMDQVYADIKQARLVIADLTGSNPNVLYELGIAQAIDKPVIQMISKGNRLPFDVQGIGTIQYAPRNLAVLKEDLVKALRIQLSLD